MKQTPSLTHDLSESNLIFVHSQLDDMGLSVSAFRIYAHLARRAGSGTAWPGIDSMASVCCVAKNTACAAVKELESRNMIEATRRKGQCTSYVLTRPGVWITTVAKEGTVVEPSQNEERTVAKEGTPPSQNRERKVLQEGTPSKAIHSPRGLAFADWFLTTFTTPPRLTPDWRAKWAKCFDDMIRLDGRTEAQIAAVCKWARGDSFWSMNFLSPCKLRDKKHGISYFDSFTEKMKGDKPKGRPEANNQRDYSDTQL